jgi:hypothetical protein
MSPHDRTAIAFLDAIEARDFQSFRALLADDVWCRAMLVRQVVELHSADETLRLFEDWYATPEELQLEARDHHPMMGRAFVRYRLRLRPQWAPDRWHRIEQAGYLTTASSQLSRIDLTCTGFYPF